MSDSCSICLEDFDFHARVRRVLDCRHSFCNLCLAVVLKEYRNCPLCRKKLTKASAEEYPVIDAFIDASSMLIENNHTSSLRTPTSLELNRSEPSTMNELELSKENFEENVHQGEFQAMNQGHQHIEMNYNRVGSYQQEAQTEQLDNAASNNTSCPPPDLRLEDFNSPEEYLQEIRSRTQRGEPVFAWHRQQSTVFYAKVFRQDCTEYSDARAFSKDFPKGLIKVGTLTLPCVDNAAVLTPFEDLKRAVQGHFIAFLRFKSMGMTFERFFRLNGSSLARQFLTLCTGEEGPSYRGCEIKGDENLFLAVKHYQLNGIPTSGRLPSTASLPTKKFESSCCRILEGFSDGSFKIRIKIDFYNPQSYSSKNVISDGCHFYGLPWVGGGPDSILDCGLVFE